MPHFICLRVKWAKKAPNNVILYPRLSLLPAVYSGFFGDGRFSEVDSPALHFLLREWGPLSKDDVFVFVLVGMSSAFGGFLISQSYRKSEAAFIAP